MAGREDQTARKARADARRKSMTIEVVELGVPKTAPYADSSPDERLAAAFRLFLHHQALRGDVTTPPRAEWPGETFTCP